MVDKGNPLVIYPEIRAITANWETRNSTFYPTQSLVGDPKTGSGYRSALYPYRIPIIKDHKAEPDKRTGAEASKIYGRAKVARFITEGKGGYTSIIAAITDPEAVYQVLTENFLTTSIGIEAEECYCSICGFNIIQGGACPDHDKGEVYKKDGKEVRALWVVGPVFHQELSFVTVPSDVNSGVINPDIGFDKIRVLIGESRDGTLLDLSSGNKFPGEQLGFFRGSPVFFFPEKKSSKTFKEFYMPDKDDALLTLGELYGLDKEHPDFGKEGTLTAKQRNNLPDSAFCGPDRSFPAQDRAHSSNGLARLNQYKGPGNKDSIRACLQRKLKQQGGKSGKENAEVLAVLKDEKYKLEIPLIYMGESVEETVSILSNLPLLEEDRKTIESVLVRSIKKNKETIPASLSECEESEDDGPAVITLNENNYPLLYNLVESIQYTDLMIEAAGDTAKEYQKTKKKEKETRERAESLETKLNSLKESNSTLEEGYNSKLEEKNKFLEERDSKIKELESKLSGDTDKVVEEIESRLKESQDETEKFKSEAQEFKTLAESLQNSVTRLLTESHLHLARQVAILKKVQGRSSTKGKTVKELTESYKQRTKSSLIDDLEEMLQEDIDSSTVFNPEKDKIENPIKNVENNGKNPPPPTPQDVVDSDVGDPTYVIYNINHKAVSERLTRDRELLALSSKE